MTSALPVSVGGTVPRLIHMVWVGSATPEWALERVSQFGALHEGWDVVLWGDDNLLPLSARLAGACPHPVVLADFVRIEALSRYGGVYLDLDMRPIRSLDPLADRPSWLVPLHTGQINNAAAGFAPGHSMLAGMWSEAQRRLERGAARHSTIAGPPVWDLLARTYPEIERLPYQAFYPEANPRKVAMTPDEVFAQDERTFAVHEWEQSWQSTYRSAR